jgi:hypothetical protein
MTGLSGVREELRLCANSGEIVARLANRAGSLSIITGSSAQVAFGPRGTIATWAGRNCYLWDITYHQG